MQQTKEFSIHKDSITAFALKLETSQLPNSIRSALDDCVIITVWYFQDDPLEQEYIEQMALLETMNTSGTKM